MQASLNRILLYVRDVERACAFYQRYFGFTATRDNDDRIVELTSPHGGVILMIHPAAKGVKAGQATVKLVFDVEDVEAFKAHCATDGLVFGATHRTDGYSFANAKDPDGNSVSISSRGFRVDR
ncbi:glyoxalase [Paraburkholderia hospita]|jgi:predicted enzyme related to lactoylglutathione lyase|uniref:Glyoxalase n=1 Tax=Paraburkholderia hospita TaxID=169430 RepID=A0ABN0FDZ4_9BURK|nr:VOC family protein [Paraburkholderia hospita]EIM96901.1 glyoxalase [Paraburkholderia hospita]OUL85382.1 glyoxalase/bleomycin resistance/dioxygenase family protein [Paraburkholderia hospita]SKC74848.1 Glyoxalase/Bleomycin resistance protein/Dioxygenase superfamily protein [Burkholderia sp. CF099]